MSIRIPGVYVEISGDITKLNKSMNEAKAIVKSSAVGMSNALNNALSPRQIESSVMGLVRNLQKVNAASKVTGATFDALSVDLGQLRTMTGLAEKEFAALQSRILKNKAMAGADTALNAVAKAAGLTKAEAIALRRSMGDLEGAARMQAQLWKDQVTNGLATASAVMSRVAIVAATLVGIGYTLKEAFDAAMRFEGLQRAYTAIYGSAAQADQQLQWLYETSNKLGLQFQSTAEASKGFFAAGQGTPLEGSLNKIFESVSRAGASLSLGQDQMNGIFLALGQMMSKGKVQAEELRGQLGERLPGAFRIAAEAMGVTTGELDKMLADGKVLAEDLLPKMADVLANKYPGAASESVKAVNSLSTEWERFKANAMDTDPIVAAINKVTKALKGASDALEDEKLTERMRAAGVVPDFQEKALFDITGNAKTDGVYSPWQKDAFRKYEITDPSDEMVVRASQQQRQAAASAENALDAALGKARGATDQFLAGSKEEKIRKVTAAWKSAVDTLADAIAKAHDAGQDTSDLEKRLVAVGAEYDRQLASLNKKEEASANKRATAREKLTADLAKMNDTGTDGEGRIAALTKEYNEFVKTLGAADAQVRQYADALAYAREHNGYTAQQVAGFTRDADKQAQELKDRADNLRKATRDDGTVDSQRLTYLEKISDAQRQYAEDVGRVGEAKALELRLLREAEARTSRAQEDLATRESFYQDLAGLYANDEALQREILDKQVRNYRDAGVAQIDLARWKARKELEMATDAASGMERALTNYYEDALNAAQNWANVTGNAFSSVEDAMVEMATTGKLNFTSMIDSMIADVMRLIVRTSITGPLAQALGGMIGELFASRNADGGIYSGPGISAYRNSIVDRPTLFPFAKGIGLMGEAGAEAIMPLTRTSGGELGVRAVGGDGAPVNVEINIVESANAKAEVKQTPTANGMRLDVIIKDVVASDITRGGTIDQAMRGAGYQRTARIAGRG